MESFLTFGEDFVLSAGTVPIDTIRKVVLCLYQRPRREFVLPKGRKNVGETLEAAATRETMEESGYDCRLLQHHLVTKAPSASPSIVKHTKPFVVQQRVNRNVKKIIFWYVSAADSSEPQM